MDIYIVIEQAEDGGYIGEAPQLRGAYAQGDTLDELMANMREVIALCLEDVARSKDDARRFFAMAQVSLLSMY